MNKSDGSMTQQWACVLGLDNILLNNYWRKFYTYQQIGWDEDSIHQYLSQKKNIMQVASFNTPRVTFSASSRRNRFYEIYNQPTMLDQDVPYDNAIISIQKILNIYKPYIISSRTEDLKEKTLEVMERLGFPLNKVEIFFKKKNEKLFNYRKNCMEEISKNYPTGVIICLNPNEITLGKRFHYTPVGFTSLKNPEDFNGHLDVICQDWPQLCSSLNCE